MMTSMPGLVSAAAKTIDLIIVLGSLTYELVVMGFQGFQFLALYDLVSPLDYR